MKKITVYALAILVILISARADSRACTETRIISKDGACVIGRSMEFAQDVNSNVIVQPRGQERDSKLPGDKDGMKWTSKYGVVYLDGFGLDIAVDGMNEKGLSVGALYFPDAAVYQQVEPGGESKAVASIDLPLYILQNFATVDEVREALPDLTVWGERVEALGNIIVPLHWSVYQPDGKGIVIEYTKAGLTVYNSIGVMTNSPEYSWHLTNMRNFVGLNSENAEPVVIDGISFAATGQGSGLMSIPGDPTPPARFIRAGAMAYLANKVDTVEEAVNLAVHVLNTVDIPIGTIRNFEDGKVYHDYTQWVVAKDLTNKILYYRTYDNMNLRAVDLKKFDLGPGGKKLVMPINTKALRAIDVSADLKPAED